MKYWTLDKHNNVVEASLEDWCLMYGNSGGTSRRIANHRIRNVEVSTVFIGLSNELFETMIFGGPHDSWQVRTDTHSEALFAHQTGCHLAFGPHWQTLIKVAEIRKEDETAQTEQREDGQ